MTQNGASHRRTANPGEWRDSQEAQLTDRQFSVAAGVANVAAKLLLHPLDTLKARLQAHPNGDLKAFRALWTVRGLYRGLLPKLALSTPYQTLYMCTYRRVRDSAMPSLGPTGAYLVGAVAAEVVASVIRIPMQVAKLRLQVDVHRTASAAGREFLSNPRGSYSFFGIQTLLHDIPYSAIQWLAYENLRQRLFHGKDKSSLTPGEGVLCGSLAGATAAVATNPMEVVKTRIITQNPIESASGKLNRCVQRIYATEGLRGFYRGLGSRVLWISSSMGAYFGLFEVVKAQMLRHRVGWTYAPALAGGH
eukprot:GGOE01004630.1.p1 GENE.GGOE01004630.1~~GGOE01004630.1.p1  ORF type:complete len:314 (+),score=85.57 GGOE01004630.1:27-944(+)